MDNGEKKKLLKQVCEDFKLDQDIVFAKYLTNGGRKKKSKKSGVNEDTNDYIETMLLEYNGTNYLVDSHGNVFTYDTENPKVVGVYKESDRAIQFYR